MAICIKHKDTFTDSDCESCLMQAVTLSLMNFGVAEVLFCRNCGGKFLSAGAFEDHVEQDRC